MKPIRVCNFLISVLVSVSASHRAFENYFHRWLDSFTARYVRCFLPGTRFLLSTFSVLYIFWNGSYNFSAFEYTFIRQYRTYTNNWILVPLYFMGTVFSDILRKLCCICRTRSLALCTRNYSLTLIPFHVDVIYWAFNQSMQQLYCVLVFAILSVMWVVPDWNGENKKIKAKAL